MRALLIDETAREEIKRVVNYAERHPYTISLLKRISDGIDPAPGDDPNYCCHIHDGFRCIYTIDQSLSGTWLKHLSISVGYARAQKQELTGFPAIDNVLAGGVQRGEIYHWIGECKPKCPSIPAAQMLMEEFGFKAKLQERNNGFSAWMENEDDPDLPTAINVVELYEKEG